MMGLLAKYAVVNAGFDRPMIRLFPSEIRTACFALLLAAGPLTALAHGGRPDSNGGHHDRKNGGYHYHNGGPARYSNPAETKKVETKGKEFPWSLVVIVVFIGSFFWKNKKQN